MLRETRLSAKARDFGLFLAVSDFYKFEFMKPDERAYFYPNTWAEEKAPGPDRLAIAPRAGYIAALVRLVETMPAPFWVLYVLVVPFPRSAWESRRPFESRTPTHIITTKVLMRRSAECSSIGSGTDRHCRMQTKIENIV